MFFLSFCIPNEVSELNFLPSNFLVEVFKTTNFFTKPNSTLKDSWMNLSARRLSVLDTFRNQICHHTLIQRCLLVYHRFYHFEVLFYLDNNMKRLSSVSGLFFYLKNSVENFTSFVHHTQFMKKDSLELCQSGDGGFEWKSGGNKVTSDFFKTSYLYSKESTNNEMILSTS